jgi:hypothetical protein
MMPAFTRHDRLTQLCVLLQVGSLDVPAKLALWGSLNPPLPYDAVSNIKSFRWDQTCIHSIGSGPSPAQFSTVFPHALSLGSTWDVGLIQASVDMGMVPSELQHYAQYIRMVPSQTVGGVTALEGRIYNQINYRLTAGTTYQAVSCDGGPLSNTVHDGRWGRISETCVKSG